MRGCLSSLAVRPSEAKGFPSNSRPFHRSNQPAGSVRGRSPSSGSQHNEPLSDGVRRAAIRPVSIQPGDPKASREQCSACARFHRPANRPDRSAQAAGKWPFARCAPRRRRLLLRCRDSCIGIARIVTSWQARGGAASLSLVSATPETCSLIENAMKSLDNLTRSIAGIVTIGGRADAGSRCRS